MQPWRRRFLLLYMMRVPLIFLTLLGIGLPLAFQTSMFHGIADLTLLQVLKAACLAFFLVSTAITSCFLILLYGQERVDGWIVQPAPQDRVSLWGVAFLYLYGGVCYVLFLVSICRFMATAGRVTSGLYRGFLLHSLFGLLLGLLVVMLFFLGALRFAKPEDDEALEVFAFPAFLIIRRIFGGAWIRSFKGGTRSSATPGSFAAHDGLLSRFFASHLGPGYGSQQTPGHPATLHSGHRFAMIVMLIFLFAYWLSGVSTLRDLRNMDQWASGGAPNTVLNFLLLFLIFWAGLFTALTFFVDRFRFPVLAVLAVILGVISVFGSSDHVFFTVESQTNNQLLTPQQSFQKAPDSVIVVAAAGGGIQSAAWTSRVLCGLRADPSIGGFQNSVLAISSVSGGSVGTMFYLRCLEGPQSDSRPAKWAQNSSLEAVAWGLTHPDLRRIFIPGPATSWSHADRGWALERSLLKSAHFQHTERRLAERQQHADWPVLLLNSTDALSGDPFIFTNSQFPSGDSPELSNHHSLRSFHRIYPTKDVLLETAVRMSASFPYVSPEARPDDPPNEAHLGDGGYFDNSGLFILSEWLKDAVSASPAGSKRILILQLDAFPDSDPPQTQKVKKWYYQLFSPIDTMLTVRSEGQVVRDTAAGEDLQKLLNGGGFETTWMLVRYTPPAANEMEDGGGCPSDPPLSWHLTPKEQLCIDTAWNQAEPKISPEILNFLKGPLAISNETCKARVVAPGVLQRQCPAITTSDSQGSARK